MYGSIKAPESAVRRCVSLSEKKNTYTFSHRRSFALAAAIALLVVTVVSAGAYGVYRYRSSAESLDSYGNSLPYSEKAPSDYTSIFEHGNETLENVSVTSDGLSITAEETYFDGRRIFISFSAEYDGEFQGVERFDYSVDPLRNSILVEGVSVHPLYGGFYLLETGEGLSGVLGLPMPLNEDMDAVDVQISIPYLVASADDEELGRVEGDFNLNLKIKKSAEALTYESSRSEDGAYVSRVYSTASALEIEYFVPDYLIEENGKNIMALPIDSEGNKKGLVSSEREQVAQGVLITASYTPLEGDRLDIILYDKNNVDGCSEELCVIKEYKDIRLH